MQLGDQMNWKLDVVYAPKQNRTIVSVKPVDAGLESSLTVLTDHRTYHLQLISPKERYMPFVTFSFPAEEENRMWEAYELAVRTGSPVEDLDEVVALVSQDTPPVPGTPMQELKKLNFNNQVSDCNCSWRPERVYDTGSRTTIEFPEEVLSGKFPSLSIASSSNEGQIVNYCVDGNRFVVDQLFDRAKLALVSGRRETSVTIDRVRSK